MKRHWILLSALMASPAFGDASVSDYDVFGSMSDEAYSNLGDSKATDVVSEEDPGGPAESIDGVLAGTDGRTEMEFKLAFEIDRGLSVEAISEVVRRAVSAAIKEEPMAFAAMIGRPYYLDEAFQAFLFRDVYLDSADHQLLASGSAYRVRHRWSRYDYYLRHQYLPFMRAFYPNRCEIQFKTGYQPDYERNVVSPEETRFEFRNESAPFDTNLDAPPAPWPVDEYVAYAQSGMYKQYRMKPMARMKEVHNWKQVPKLEPQIKVLTVRDRIHLNMANPWGSGPNPEQVFIITLDKSTIGDTYGRPKPDTSILELEIEIERNVSTEIHRTMELGVASDMRFAAVANTAVQYSGKAWNALVADLDVLRERVAKEVSLMTGRDPLPLDYKYARLMGRVLDHPPTAETAPERKRF